MLTRPAKLLPVYFTLGAPLAADVDGKIYRFTATLTMANPQIHSDLNLNSMYDLTDLNIGHYVATDPGGRIMKIVAIASQNAGVASVTVEDEFRQNQQQDSTGNGDAYITSNTGIIFEVVEGKPILFPYGDQSTEVVGFVKDYASEIQSRFEYLRQSKLIDVTQAHSFVVGDLITYDTVTSTYQLLTTNTVWVGTVIEVDNPITGSFRYRPTGSIVDIALAGAGPYFYWDNSNPGKLTSTTPASGQRVVPAFFKLSSTQAIYFQGGAVTNLSGNFVTLDTAQTITGAKTFNAVVNVANDTNSSSTTTGAIVVAGGVGIGDNLTVGGNLSVSGDMTISGTATIVNTTNLSVSDKLIELASGTTGAPVGDSGLIIERGNQNNIFIGWDESEDVVSFGEGSFTGVSTGDLTITDTNIRFASSRTTAGYNLVTNTNAPEVSSAVYVLYGTTTNGIQTELFLDSSNTRVTLNDNTTMMFEVTVVARNSAANKHEAIKVEGVADRTTSNTVLVTTTIETIYAQDNNTWAVVVEADNTNDTIAVKVTGEVGQTIKWTAFVKTININH
jgi:hypothetical protein